MSSPEERFSALFERTDVALLGYAVRRPADPADAADVVAETCLVAWRDSLHEAVSPMGTGPSRPREEIS